MSKERIGNEEVIEQLPRSLRQLTIWERFHLYKASEFQRTSNDPAFDTRFFPQNCGALELPCYWVRRKHLYVYGGQPTGADELTFFEGEGRQAKVLFPIHPSAVDQYSEFLHAVDARDAAVDGLRIWAVPTSSTRTLLAWPDGAPGSAVFIKTSLHSRIFGDRRLHPQRVCSSIGYSRLVLDSLSQLPNAVRYFPETVGLTPRRMPESGAIVRSIPEEIRRGRVLVAPLFSLFGGGNQHTPLMLTILERSGLQPREFVEDLFCKMFSRAWLDMGMRSGVMLEAHAQDLMLALSPELIPLGCFYYRDFEGLQVDWELRRRLGLAEPANMPRAWRWYETYETRGTRYTHFVWYKWMTSLLGYFYFVLNAMEESMREWRKHGLPCDWEPQQDELTVMFSQHMMRAIEEMFGIRIDCGYNIYRSQRKFAMLLLTLRKDLVCGSRRAQSNAVSCE